MNIILETFTQEDEEDSSCTLIIVQLHIFPKFNEVGSHKQHIIACSCKQDGCIFAHFFQCMQLELELIHKVQPTEQIKFIKHLRCIDSSNHKTSKLLNNGKFLKFLEFKNPMLKHKLFQVQNTHLFMTPRICSCSRMAPTPTPTFLPNLVVEWLQLDCFTTHHTISKKNKNIVLTFSPTNYILHICAEKFFIM